MKPTQRNIILKQLRENGFVTRNWALSQYITRLGALICVFRKESMDITAEFKNGDYVYTLKDKPEIVNYYVQGQVVATKKIW